MCQLILAYQISVQPSLDEVNKIVENGKKLSNAPNLIPLCASISSEFLTPSAIYLKVAAKYARLIPAEHVSLD